MTLYTLHRNIAPPASRQGGLVLGSSGLQERFTGPHWGEAGLLWLRQFKV